AGRTDEVAVMYAGRVVERAPTPVLFAGRRMPYTEALLAAIPKLDAAPHTPLATVAGRPPDPTRRIFGCAFAPRCKYAVEHCRYEAPPLAGSGPEHLYACWLPLPAQQVPTWRKSGVGCFRLWRKRRPKLALSRREHISVVRRFAAARSERNGGTRQAKIVMSIDEPRRCSVGKIP